MDAVFLNFSGLFHDAFVGVGDFAFEKGVPFLIRKSVIIQQFQLFAEVGDERLGIMDDRAFVALFDERLNKRLFQFRFALVGVGAFQSRRTIMGDDRFFVGRKRGIVDVHGGLLFFKGSS